MGLFRVVNIMRSIKGYKSFADISNLEVGKYYKVTVCGGYCWLFKFYRYSGDNIFTSESYSLYSRTHYEGESRFCNIEMVVEGTLSKITLKEFNRICEL